MPLYVAEPPPTTSPTPAEQGSAGPGSAGLRTVRIGFVGLSDCAPILVARAQGFDTRHGLRLLPQREPSWAGLRDGLLQGGLDAAHCLYGMPFGLHLGIGGPRHPMAILMGLSSNGQGIVFSQRLLDAGVVDGASLAAAIRAGNRPFTFAQTFPTGTHAMWLSYWLASHGIDPGRDIRTTTVPPPQMVARLLDGSIDGCCVGEPWPAAAEVHGAGRTVVRSEAIWPNHPEKVLCARARLVRETPDVARALIATMLDACRHLDTPDGRREAARLIAHPDYVDVPLSTLEPRFLAGLAGIDGPLAVDPDNGAGESAADAPAAGLRFFDGGRVTYPWRSDGMWFLTQFARWGLLPEGTDIAATAAAVQQESLYREAALLCGVASPPDGLRDALLCDGQRWDPRDPAAYAEGFVIHA